MSEGIKKLPRGRLQAFIGDDLMKRLETLLPAVIESGGDIQNLYDKRSLATVVDAFAGEKILGTSEYRRELLNHQREDVLDRIVSRGGLKPASHEFQAKVDAIVRAGWSDPEFATLVLNELGLSMSHAPSYLEQVPPLDIVLRPKSPFKSLKDFQFPVFNDAKNRLSVPRNRFIVQMPTGSGKTRTAMEVIADHLNYSEKGGVVLWLAHSSELCEQAHAAFREVWEHIGQHDVAIGKLWGSDGLSTFEFSERGFVVASFQKAYALGNKLVEAIEPLRQKVSLIVVDEAHKAIAPTYKKAIKALTNDNTQIMGLTATPGRSAVDSKENRALSDFFFGSIVEIETPADESVVGYLRRRKILSEARYEPLISGRNYGLNKEEKNKLERFFDFPAGFLGRVAADDIRNIEIVKRINAELSEGRKVLLFACSVEHSKFLCGCLNFLGWKAGHIDGEIGYARRGSLIEEFKQGKIEVVTNYGVLSTGFDVPKIDVVFIARPTASVVLYSQMIGRGLRGPEIGGTEQCKIIDVVDNIEGYSDAERVYEYFSEFWS